MSISGKMKADGGMRVVGGVALGVLVLDQGSKVAVVQGLDLATRHEIAVWPPFLVFRMAWNRGVNFGLLAGDGQLVRWGLVLLSLGIVGWVWWWLRRRIGDWRVQVAGGLLIGGALGNVVDRLIYGAVADFLNMSCCGISNPFSFNVADIAIFAGALGLVVFGERAKTA